MFGLSGKVAIVTGGARGIGEGISLTLAEAGADIAVAARTTEQIEQVAKRIRQLGRRCLPVPTDVTKEKQVQSMVERTIAEFGKIDILVNNAGWDKIELFINTSSEFWDKLIDINYKQLLYTNRAVLDHMIENKYGRIVNIGSDSGRVGSTGEAVLSGCKGAVIAFTKAMARELARFNITVNCVCPGPTETPLMDELKKGELGGKLMATMVKRVPLGRLATPQDIAYAVAFMASDEAGYITGQTLSVSGGLTMA